MCLEINQVCLPAKDRPKGAGILGGVGIGYHAWSDSVLNVVAVFT